MILLNLTGRVDSSVPNRHTETVPTRVTPGVLSDVPEYRRSRFLANNVFVLLKLALRGV